MFESSDPRRAGKAITRQSVWRVWKMVAATAGLRDVNFGTHSARKTTAVVAYKATGGDVARVANLLGQSDLQSIPAYLGMTESDAEGLSEACG